MRLKIMEIVLSELLVIANTSIEVFLHPQYDAIIPACFNVFLSILIGFIRIQNLLMEKEFQKAYYIFLNIRLLIIVIQYSLLNTDFSLLLINHLEVNNLKLAILLKFALVGILQGGEYFTKLPYNVLFYAYCVYVWLQLGMINNQKSSKNVPKELTIAQKVTLDAPPTFNVKSQQELKQDEESKGQSSSEIKPLQLNSNQQAMMNEDDIIVTNMSWLSNQQVLVYNNEFNIIYQTFYLGKLQKNIGDKVDCENVFLESVILIGCKEINELLGQSGYSDSIFSDGSFLFLNEVHKVRIKGQFTIRELITCLIKDYEKWKFFTLTIFKVKNDLLDLEGVQIKLFITQIDGHKYLLFTLEQMPPVPKQVDNSPILQNIYNTYSHENINYVNSILTLILLLTHHLDSEGDYNKDYIVNCIQNMRQASQRQTLFLYSMRDYIFYLNNQLFFKMNAIRIEELLEDLLQNFESTLQLKQIRLTTNIELSDGNTVIFSDQDRIKQIISCLLSYCISSSHKSDIRFEIKSYTLQGIMITIKDTKADFDEPSKQKIINLTKQLNQQLKSQKGVSEVDLTNPLELQMCILLCWQLAGSFKRGLEFLIDNQGFCTFTFVIESQTNQIKYQNSGADIGPIRVLGKKKYFETSLSLLLQENLNSNIGGESKLLSFTQLSKQFSIKPTDPIDLQSAYLSQISKIRQETSNSRAAFPNSGTIHKQSREQSGSFSGTKQLQSDSIQQITRILNRNNLSVVGKIESPNESQRTFTLIDFGAAEQPTNQMTLPDFNPKLLTQVIKFRLRANCCAKVLILDFDPFSIIVLEKVLQKYDIKCDFAFNAIEGFETIDYKRKRPCHCGNRHYLLYFIDLNVGGSDFVQRIKKLMLQGSMDKGFAIATATVVDLNAKLECFRSGMDYFIGKPFDLIEISAAVQYLDF